MRAELKKWQVQTLGKRSGKWKSRGTYKTRATARAKAKDLRGAWGFGFTRVVRKITGGL